MKKEREREKEKKYECVCLCIVWKENYDDKGDFCESLFRKRHDGIGLSITELLLLWLVLVKLLLPLVMVDEVSLLFDLEEESNNNEESFSL